MIKNALYITALLLVLFLFGNLFFNFQASYYLGLLVYGSLGISIFASMLLLRNTEPGIHIKHREKIERKTAVVVMTVLPIFLVLEYLSKKLEFFSFMETDIPITLSVFFIILASSKLIDDLTRLSLLKPANAVKPVEVNRYKLTPREQEVAALLVKGYTYSKIGETLFISMPTVKTHASNIYRKVGVKNKMELFYALSE